MRRLLLAVFGVAVLSIFGAPRGFCADVVGVVADTQARPVANVKILVEKHGEQRLKRGTLECKRPV